MNVLGVVTDTELFHDIVANKNYVLSGFSSQDVESAFSDFYPKKIATAEYYHHYCEDW